ncbi:MAG TPA: nuclear transport factor 2 family protein [Solirubrobacteraceae bacterium]
MTNKDLLEDAFAALAEGDGSRFTGLFADDFTWTLTGTTPWSGTYSGKDAVWRDLLRPLLKQFAGPYTNRALRFVAEGDIVVVECRGHVETTSGKIYANSYCYICRFAGGKLRELVEYMDTDHLMQVLDPPYALLG